MRAIGCLALLLLAIPLASSTCCADATPADRFQQGLQIGQEMSRQRQERDRQAQQRQESRDDVAERMFKDCLTDPWWRKGAKPEQLVGTLTALQVIEKRKYGLVITSSLPDLTPQFARDLEQWCLTPNPPTDNYKWDVKGMLLMKYGESVLAQIASGLQKTTASPSTPLKTWQNLVDDMFAKWTPPQRTDPLLSPTTTPMGATPADSDKKLGAVTSIASSTPKARALPSTMTLPLPAVPNILTSATSTAATLLPPLNNNGNASRAASTYLGRLSSNRYDLESTSNAYGAHGNPYGNTLANPFSPYGSRFSSTSWSNPYATDPPRIYAQDGTYLGKLSTNPYDADSISNPYGKYGSPYGNSLMNPYSVYGSRFSSQSWTNPYATTAPGVYGSSGR